MIEINQENQIMLRYKLDCFFVNIELSEKLNTVIIAWVYMLVIIECLFDILESGEDSCITSDLNHLYLSTNQVQNRFPSTVQIHRLPSPELAKENVLPFSTTISRHYFQLAFMTLLSIDTADKFRLLTILWEVVKSVWKEAQRTKKVIFFFLVCNYVLYTK